MLAPSVAIWYAMPAVASCCETCWTSFASSPLNSTRQSGRSAYHPISAQTRTRKPAVANNPVRRAGGSALSCARSRPSRPANGPEAAVALSSSVLVNSAFSATACSSRNYRI
jgi:hypothetical protein